MQRCLSPANPSLIHPNRQTPRQRILRVKERALPQRIAHRKHRSIPLQPLSRAHPHSIPPDSLLPRQSERHHPVQSARRLRRSQARLARVARIPSGSAIPPGQTSPNRIRNCFDVRYKIGLPITALRPAVVMSRFSRSVLITPPTFTPRISLISGTVAGCL